MCGLVGYIGETSIKAVQVFEDLLQMDVIRGKDSCGIAICRNKHAPIVLKDVTLPSWLLEDERYVNVMKKNDYQCLIGHNRWATRGKVTVRNAHPFRIGAITMAHNGTLEALHKLPLGCTFDTDSEALCHAINELGIEETWKLVLGAATITYFDMNDKTLNMISNGKRPLHWAYTKDNKGMVWASEFDMLRMACKRRELSLSEDGKIFYPENDTLFKFKFDGKVVTHTARKLDPYVYTFQVAENGHKRYDWPYGTFDDEQELWAANKVERRGQLVVTSNENNVSKVVYKETNIATLEPITCVNIRRKLISEAEFERDYDRCLMCNASLVGDYDGSVITDYDRHLAVCSQCADTAADTGQELEGRLL